MPRTRKSEIDQLRAEMAELGRRLMELTGEGMEDVEDSAGSFSDAAREMLREKFQEKWSRASEFGRRTGARVQEYAEENPWQMLAAGAMVGFMIAQVLKRDRE